MKEKSKGNYVYILITILGCTIAALKGETSYDSVLTILGFILFTILFGYMLITSRDSKGRMLGILAMYLFFAGIFLLN